MHTFFKTILRPPEFANYEKMQKARLIHFMLLAVFAGAVVTFFVSFSNRWNTEALLQSLLFLCCLVGFYLNHTRRPELAGLLLCISLFFTLGFLLFHGIGLFDSTILGYPIFILYATFLFQRRGGLIATMATVVSMCAMYFLELYGIYEPMYPLTLLRTAVISLLFVLIALIIWVIRDTWQNNLAQLRQSYDLTLRGWAKAVEYRDDATVQHTNRVTHLSVMLARNLGLPEEEIRDIRRGAYLHDIGKLAVPDSLLKKNRAANLGRTKTDGAAPHAWARLCLGDPIPPFSHPYPQLASRRMGRRRLSPRAGRRGHSAGRTHLCGGRSNGMR